MFVVYLKWLSSEGEVSAQDAPMAALLHGVFSGVSNSSSALVLLQRFCTDGVKVLGHSEHLFVYALKNVLK